jgi:hypothetical protein
MYQLLELFQNLHPNCLIPPPPPLFQFMFLEQQYVQALDLILVVPLESINYIMVIQPF